jgi:hypothetical protein
VGCCYVAPLIGTGEDGDLYRLKLADLGFDHGAVIESGEDGHRARRYGIGHVPATSTRSSRSTRT